MSKTYRTIAGDTWDMIAFRELGDERYTDQLMRANTDHRETIIFPANIVLNIPDIPEESKIVNLPPWKR